MTTQRSNTTTMPAAKVHEENGRAYCPICTHTVDARVIIGFKHAKVAEGQRCGRCLSSLDAAYVVRIDRAA